MDIFGIMDPDPHENLCGSETLLTTGTQRYKETESKFEGGPTLATPK